MAEFRRSISLAVSIVASLIVCAYSQSDLDVRTPPFASAMLGGSVLFECIYAASGVPEDELNFYWAKVQDGHPDKVIYSFYRKKEHPENVDVAYRERSKLVSDEPYSGNVSILLQNVTLADQGSYECYVKVRDQIGRPKLQLTVAAYYSVSFGPSGGCCPVHQELVNLICEAKGGYPEANVTIHDSEGSELTANTTISENRTQDGLYNITVTSQVSCLDNTTYICNVESTLGMTVKRLNLTCTDVVPDNLPWLKIFTCCAFVIALMLIVMTIAVTVYEVKKFKCRKNKSRSRNY